MTNDVSKQEDGDRGKASQNEQGNRERKNGEIGMTVKSVNDTVIGRTIAAWKCGRHCGGFELVYTSQCHVM